MPDAPDPGVVGVVSAAAGVEQVLAQVRLIVPVRLSAGRGVEVGEEMVGGAPGGEDVDVGVGCVFGDQRADAWGHLRETAIELAFALSSAGLCAWWLRRRPS